VKWEINGYIFGKLLYMYLHSWYGFHHGNKWHLCRSLNIQTNHVDNTVNLQLQCWKVVSVPLIWLLAYYWLLIKHFECGLWYTVGFCLFQVWDQISKYRVSINSFPDYRHLLQENYVEYRHIFCNLTINTWQKILETNLSNG
jgi:hypothetical protein